MDTPLPNFFDRFIGQPWARIEAEVISLPHDSLRVLKYDSITTAEYRATRITVWLNRDNTVESIGYN
jgi:hypothetical protein